MMTLDYAIIYYDRKAIDCKKNMTPYDDEHFGYLYGESLEYKQLADWLNELKILRERVERICKEKKLIESAQTTGHWEEVVVNCLFGEKATMCKCSECKEVSLLSYKFCPECGSRNKGIRKFSEIIGENND